ncbi:MAG: F420-dependent oxidoreductase [Candidatus Dadabacteria bacterium CSP1-2]|jgi:coenzyme F420-0:L-glutamate ligase/coenzyme F420-1:gamma-L-glutamate ligase|nr:MAG: F420-dependent oxidoreductase [Candidatus Dadabacteria bacterium CSP1-2]
MLSYSWTELDVQGTQMPNSITIIPIFGLPEIKPGHDLVKMVIEATSKQDLKIQDRDIFVFAQKIVSKSEGRIVKITDVSPSPFAVETGKLLDKDPRIVEIILRESRRIVKMDRGRLIVENTKGIVCANAGVDMSNVGGGMEATLLPEDPDESAKRFAEGFKKELGVDVAVIITDTVGRPWRDGLVQIAIGCYGISPLKDYRGKKDSKGYDLRATALAVADEISSAAGLVMGKTEGVPVAVVRGYEYEKSTEGTKRLLRNPENDLFR